MLKKVLVYGFAFGSASAALLLIQYFNRLYAQRSLLSALPVMGSVLITILAVFLVIRALRRDGSLVMGKALFAGLLTSAVIALMGSLAYQFLLENHPLIMNDYRSLLEERKLAAGKEAADFDIDKFMSLGTFMRSQFSMNLSIGMMVSSVVFLLSPRKQGSA